MTTHTKGHTMRQLLASVIIGVAAMPAAASYGAAVHADTACHTVHRGTGVLRITEQVCEHTVTTVTPRPVTVRHAAVPAARVTVHPFHVCTWCVRVEV